MLIPSQSILFLIIVICFLAMRMIKDDRKKISEDTNGMSMTFFKDKKKYGSNIKKPRQFMF